MHTLAAVTVAFMGLTILHPSKQDVNDCLMERIKCSSSMADRYGLDVWRYGVLTSINFSLLLNTIHSQDDYKRLCLDFETLKSCLNQSECPTRPWLARVQNAMSRMKLDSSCSSTSLEKLGAVTTCWSDSSLRVIEAQKSCHNDYQYELRANMMKTATDALTLGLQDLNDNVLITQQAMCLSMINYLSCLNSHTANTCGIEAANWEMSQLMAFTASFHDYYQCDATKAQIILIVVSIVLSLVGLQFLLVVAYVAVQHYKYSATVKKIETKLQPVKEKLHVLAKWKKTPA